MTRKPLTPAQRVRRAEAKAIDAGALRLTNVLIRDQRAIQALDRLKAQHGSTTGAITQALIQADQ